MNIFDWIVNVIIFNKLQNQTLVNIFDIFDF